jgi:hypothetical protein
MNPNALSLQLGQDRAAALRQEAAQLHRVRRDQDQPRRTARPSLHALLVRLRLA